MLSYFLVLKKGIFSSREAIPDTIVAVKTPKDSLIAKKVAKSTEVKAEKPKTIQKDSLIIPAEVAVATPVETAVTAPVNNPMAKKEEVKKTPPVEKPAVAVSRSTTPIESAASATGYKVISKAYFYNEPDESTRRAAFVNHWNNSYATIKPIDEKNGFIYVVFQNHLGQTSKGWLRKKDLIDAKTMAYSTNDR